MSINYDVCDLDRIYNETYQYSLPQNVLKDWLSGKGFDYSGTYSEEEVNALKNDIRNIYQ